MKTQTLISSIALLATASALAGGEKGNGGHGILCIQDGKKTVVQYDFFEGIDKYKLVYDLKTDVDTVDAQVNLVLGRIERLNPNRAKLYRGWYETFFSEAEMKRGRDLMFIPDAGDGEIPTGCELKQLAIQREPKFPKEKRYSINADLWDLMDATNQASLIVHELIYREALGMNHDNSKNARYLHEMLMTKAVETMNLKQYIELLRLVDFTTADSPVVTIQLSGEETGGLPAGTRKTVFDDQGRLAEAVLDSSRPFTINGLTANGGSDRPVSFHPNGIPRAFYGNLIRIDASTPSFERLVLEPTFLDDDAYIELDSEARLLYYNKYNNNSVKGRIDSRWVSCELANFTMPEKRYVYASCLRGSIRFLGRNYPVTGPFSTWFQPGDNKQNAELNSPVTLPIQPRLQAPVTGFDILPSGEYQVGIALDSIGIDVQERTIGFTRLLKFYADGKLREGRLLSKEKLRTRDGIKKFPAGSRVQFDPDGTAHLIAE